MPGSPAEIIGNLSALLRDIAKDGWIDRPFTWPGADSPIRLRKALHPLGACGLVSRQGRPARVVLTDEARNFLDSGDDLYLIAVIHANVRFIGEALAALEHGLTHNELNELATREYGLKWSSLDQVRRRVYLLRAAGLVDYWSNGKVHSTERGRQLLEHLKLVDPDHLPHRRRPPAQAAELPSPPPLLAARLAEVDQATLRSRKRPMGYIAGGGRVEVLSRLVNAAVPDITRSDFRAFCVEEFGVLESSAEQTLGTLRSFGLLVQVGTDTFAATELAASCLASDEALDFIRLLHLNVALLGETLDALDNEANSSTLTRILAERYPLMQLSRDGITRRLALFLETGLAERIGLTIRRTELGTVLAQTLPLLQRAGADDVVESTNRDITLRDSRGTAHGTADHGTRGFGLVATEVVEAATDSTDYQRFERAVAAAFRVFGIDVESCGGPKKTDVVINLWLSPINQQRIAVDAKTDGAGLVTDQDVKFWRLGEHRERHKAQSTVLVGPRFDARVEQEAAKENVALLTARELADAVMRHSRTPLAPYQIAALVTAGGGDALELRWRAAERRQETLRLVLDTLWNSGNDPVDIQYTKGALGIGDIWRETKGVLETPLDRSEIEEALTFLGTPYVDGVTKQHSDYVVTAPPSLTAARLRALATAIESTGPGGSRAEEPPALPTPSDSEPPAGRSVPRQQDPSATVAPSLVRSWAKTQGRAVSGRGRLPEVLVREYKRAHDLE